MSPRPAAASPRSGRRVVAVGAVVATLGLGGCHPEWLVRTAGTPDVHGSELADAGGRPCPDTLPVVEDPRGYGFGIDDEARVRPSLLAPQRGWVCTYEPVDDGPAGNGGVRTAWRLAGRPEPLADDVLPLVVPAVDALTLHNPWDGCTDDLGRTWLVVTEHGGDLTGIAVDSFGCRYVRLTDDPHSTQPAADDQEGTVGGVFYGGGELLDTLGIDDGR